MHIYDTTQETGERNVLNRGLQPAYLAERTLKEYVTMYDLSFGWAKKVTNWQRTLGLHVNMCRHFGGQFQPVTESVDLHDHVGTGR